MQILSLGSVGPGSLLRHLLGCAALLPSVLRAAETSPGAADSLRWSVLAPLPDREGFAFPYAGVHGGALLVAGGANFPDKRPWEGGAKVWYDTVFVLERPAGEWRIAGKLPRPLGYGVSLSTPEGVVCLGGSDVARHYAECFLLRWVGGRLERKSLPPLPKPCANFCGALVGNTVYVAGGIETPDATRALQTFWALELGAGPRQWRELAAWPGPGRMLAVAATHDGDFFLLSGTSLAPDAQGKPARTYLRDAYRFRPGQGWRQVADLPHAVVGAPTPAATWGPAEILVLGGDDGSLVNFTPLAKHPGFPGQVLAYAPASDTWRVAGRMPVAHVTTPLVRWQDRVVMPTGEVRPGVRSPAVWSLQNP